MKMIKTRIICGVLAAAVALGAATIPTIVRAEDLPGCLDDLKDLSPEEMYILKHLQDLDEHESVLPLDQV